MYLGVDVGESGTPIERKRGTSFRRKGPLKGAVESVAEGPGQGAPFTYVVARQGGPLRLDV